MWYLRHCYGLCFVENLEITFTAQQRTIDVSRENMKEIM